MTGNILPRAGSSAGGGRRFLLTGVVSRYQLQPLWNREELAADLQRMVALFTGELGYQHVPVMGLDPTWLQIQDALRDFCTSADRRADDYVVVYLAGHGEILQVGDSGFEHVLLPADAIAGDLRRRAVKSADLAEWMLADTPVRRLLLIVDACYSGMGGLDFARNALARVGTPARLTEPDGAGVVVVTATQSAQQAIAGAFTTAFARAVRSQATAGHVPGTLSIDAVLNVLRDDPELPASQQARWYLVAGSGTIPNFLPNPRRDDALVDLDLAEQDRRWRTRLTLERKRAEEMRGQFVPPTLGFTGRHRSLAGITRWLETPADPRPTIVTGDPGSGKTAVLGLLAALADPSRRPTVPRDGLPADAIPEKDVIGVAIYAGNLTAGQILAGLAAAAGQDDVNSDPAALGSGLTRLLAGLRGRGRPLVAMIDALDEAADPRHLAEELLRPLMEQGRGAIRLLLGTRRHVCDHLGRGWQDRCQVIDLDGPDYADPVALAELIRRTLTGVSPAPGSPIAGTSFASCRPALLDAVTAAIAEAAGHSFFVARILAGTQAVQPAIPDPGNAAWRAGLPRTAGPAMRRDLDLRLREKASQAVDLLLPLAYARGGGLPWEDMWALLANALAPGLDYTNEDLLWLVGHAGSFIVEGGTISGRSTYRLYHRSLAEDLIADRDQAADHRAITVALTNHVPRRHSGRSDWPASHPYTRAHLATHATRGGVIDDLAQDPGFLLAADPPELLAALDHATSRPARAAAGAYRNALPVIRRHPPAEHASYMGLAARCGRAETLADRIDADGLVGPWCARWASWQLQHTHQQITGHDGSVLAVTVAELDGRPVVISGSDDRTVRVWDSAIGTSVGDPFTGHDGWVRAVTVAELDGRPVVISGSDDRTVRVWDLATGTPVSGQFTGHNDWVRAVTVAELDGRPVVISGSDDRTVQVWDLATGTPLGEPFTGHGGPVLAVAVAEMGGRPVVISGSGDGTVRVWDLSTGAPVGDPFTGHDGAVNAVAVAELDGGPVVISGSGDGTVRVWDLSTGIPVGDPFTGHDGAVNAVAVADLDGRRMVVSGSDDETVRVWDLATGVPVGDPFTGHDGLVLAVAVAELDERPVVISGSDDETVRVWDLSTGIPVGDPFTGHDGAVNAVAVADVDGRPVVISGSDEETVRVWDLSTGAPVGEPFTGHGGPVLGVVVAELDERPVVISGSGDKTLRVWDLSTRIPVGDPFRGHDDWVRAVAVAELGGRPVVISGSDDGTVRMWDLSTGTPVGDPFRGHNDWVLAVAVAELDGRPVVISGSFDKTVRVWDLATGTPVGDPFTGHDGAINVVAVEELDGRPVVISGGGDGTVRMWDLATGTQVGDPFTGHDGPVLAVAVGELGGRPVVISGSDDGTVRVWDLATGTPVGDPFTGHSGRVLAVAVAELGGRPVVISGSFDKTVRVWDLAAGEPVGDPFTGHNDWVRAVTVAELDGRPVVISGSVDKTVRVWDLATGTPVGEPFTGHHGAVNAVAVAELDGRPVVISGSDDRTVRVWDLSTGAPVGDPFTGHDDWVRAVAVAELEGRPVVISGSDDRTVRVWDLSTGAPVGDPFTGHDDWVLTVAVAELDGRPVVISGSSDETVQVWDLATGTRVGGPFTGHYGPVNAVAVVELDGRPVVISGSSDETVQVWDLATETRVGEPFTGHDGPINAVTSETRRSLRQTASPVHVGIGARNIASISTICRDDVSLQWKQIAAPEVKSNILALAFTSWQVIVVAAELGIVVFDLLSEAQGS